MSADRKAFYASHLPTIRKVAQEKGYAIGVHGSEERDFDLIAAPWVDGASSADDLAQAVADAVGAYVLFKAEGQMAGIKPLGRRAYTICFHGDVEERYPHPGKWAVFIDLSVAPMQVAA